MFYGQCWKCGERWGLGTASTCKCPEELPTYTFKQSSELMIATFDMKPNHNMTFHNGGKQVGVLDFNGPEIMFNGDMNESAKVFFDFIASAFKGRLEQERADEREACAKVCDDLPAPDYVSPDDVTVWDVATLDCGDAIRARGNT